jgi:hypothetical protein
VRFACLPLFARFARARKNRPAGRFFLCRRLKAYWLAPEAGAAAEAVSEAAAAAPEAAAADSLAAAALEAAAPASEAAAAGAEAADVSLAAGAAAWSLLLLHAARATAANRDATRRDFFMITSFYG